MCGPAAVFGIGSAILGIGSQIMAYQQAKADTAFYNKQKQLEYSGAVLQAQANRNTESIRSQMNKNFQAQTKFMADRAFENKVTGLLTEQQQIQVKTAQELTEREIEAKEKAGSIKASGRIGLTADSLRRAIKAQKGAADFLTSQNTAFAFIKGQQEKKVAAATRGSRIASAKDYIETTYLDPVKPLKKQAPGFGQYALGMASSALGGYSTAMGIAADRKVLGLKPWDWGKA
jgi:hypothetical protein